MTGDTIAAISTPIGEGGLAVIRLSGSDAIAVAQKCFSNPARDDARLSTAPSHTIHYGHIHLDGKTLDEVLVAVMRAPKTFTKEDVVEITCHGGVLPAKMVLDATLRAGARLAEPGEFARRAFLNGRIDLAQAEAVADLIHSRTELALLAANEQLAGKLSTKINALRDDMMKALAHIEAHIDFPDEDISPDTKDQLERRLKEAVRFMDDLLRTASEGQILRRGVRAAIIGRPNAGKSSLLNQLLGRDRAIVSEIPGTTRDTIEETANIRGLPIVFIDTAGFRDARDEIEREGIRRSRKSIQQADLVLHVLDSSQPLGDQDLQYLDEAATKKRVLVLNKSDLGNKLELPDDSSRVVPVSCLTGEGIEGLKDAIKEIIWAGEIRTEMLEVMINSRHQDALSRAREATQRAISAFTTAETLEVVAMELRIAVNAVGEVVGKTTTEDILDLIFSTFCIGK
jgi:tRNA modification GTPase